MCGKTPKAETVVHPAGQDWANADPTFAYSPDMQNLRPAQPGDLYPGRGYTDPDDAPDDLRYLNSPDDRLSAPPRASLADKVGMVLGLAARRLCDRHVASCAILVATGVFVALGAFFALIAG